MDISITPIVCNEQIQLVLSYFRDYFPSLQDDDVRFQKIAEKITEYGHFLLATADGNAVGFAAFYANDIQSNTAILTLIAIKQEYRKFGIGSRLLHEVFAVSAEVGMQKIRLEVRHDNLPAIAFYQKNGFWVDNSSDNIFTTMVKIL